MNHELCQIKKIKQRVCYESQLKVTLYCIICGQRIYQKAYSNNSVNIYLPQSIVFGNIHLFSIFSSVGFESGGLSHIAYIDTIYAYIQHLMVISVKEYGQRFSWKLKCTVKPFFSIISSNIFFPQGRWRLIGQWGNRRDTLYFLYLSHPLTNIQTFLYYRYSMR